VLPDRVAYALLERRIVRVRSNLLQRANREKEKRARLGALLLRDEARGGFNRLESRPAHNVVRGGSFRSSGCCPQLVLIIGNHLDNLLAESRNIVRLAAGDEVSVDDDLLVDPVRAGVLEVCP
jgi:hypothetical protein